MTEEITPTISSFTFNPFGEKTYLLRCGDSACAVIDPGMCCKEECDVIFELITANRLQPEAVLLTHAHPDHIFGVRKTLETFGDIPVYMHPKDRPVKDYAGEQSRLFGMPAPDCNFRTKDIADREKIVVGSVELEVIHTPGHTPGGVCYLNRREGILFCGDTLFAEAIGRTDLKFGEYDDEIRSVMEKLILLDPATRILPGHGPESTIGEERTSNPFLEPFNEPEESTEGEEIEPVVIRSDLR